MLAFRKAVLIGVSAMTIAAAALAAPESSKGKTEKAGPEPAAASTSGSGAYNGPPVMDPSLASGMAAVGYASAKAAPEVMAKLFCYCGCDMTDSHTALIDCFTGQHGMDCHICQEEAVLALRMHRDGASIAEIQKRVDAEFSKQYPFTEKTAALKKYEAMRAGTPAPAASTGTEKSASKPKLKPGMTAGDCCKKGK
jgi:hypothetical protein